MKYDVAIIGGGAAGLFCAINVAQDKKVVIIEKSDRVGKKILATGNGRCNLTNNNISAKYYNIDLVEKYFKQFDNYATIKFFDKMGLATYSDEEGRVYPLSNSAVSVLDILLESIANHINIDIKTNYVIDRIVKREDLFEIDGNEKIEANKIVIATGGNSADILDGIGVKYNGFKPSLVGLNTAKNKGLAGVRVDNVRVRMGLFDEVGEVLFKENGLSGIVIFNLSASLSRNNIVQGEVLIDFLPGKTVKWIWDRLKQMQSNHPCYKVITILEGLIHKALAKNILDKLSISCDSAIADISDIKINEIVNIIKNYVVFVTGLSDNNQVHSGGVDLHMLDNSLQYREIDGLYCAGEVIDVDGVCGGYNLQWAWTSGKIVGDNI